MGDYSLKGTTGFLKSGDMDSKILQQQENKVQTPTDSVGPDIDQIIKEMEDISKIGADDTDINSEDSVIETENYSEEDYSNSDDDYEEADDDDSIEENEVKENYDEPTIHIKHPSLENKPQEEKITPDAKDLADNFLSGSSEYGSIQSRKLENLMKEEKLMEMENYKSIIEDMGRRINIELPNDQSSIQEIEATNQLLLHMIDRLQFSSIPEEVILAGSRILEKFFDGDKKFLGVKPNYTGFQSYMKGRLRQIRPMTSSIVSNFFAKHRTPTWARAAFTIGSSLAIYPFINDRKPQKKLQSIYSSEKKESDSSVFSDIMDT